MDGAILIVGGDDGVMPQSREHLLLAKQVSFKIFKFRSTGKGFTQCLDLRLGGHTGDRIDFSW